MERLKEEMLTKLKDQISTQTLEIEALQQRLQECENEQSKAVGALQQRLQEAEDKLAKETKERKKLSSEIETLKMKLRTDEELEKTKWRELSTSMKKEVKREVTENVSSLEKSIEKNENELKTLPASIKRARGKEISDMEDRMKDKVSKLKDQVTTSSQKQDTEEASYIDLVPSHFQLLIAIYNGMLHV